MVRSFSTVSGPTISVDGGGVSLNDFDGVAVHETSQSQEIVGHSVDKYEMKCKMRG